MTFCLSRRKQVKRALLCADRTYGCTQDLDLIGAFRGTEAEHKALDILIDSNVISTNLGLQPSNSAICAVCV